MTKQAQILRENHYISTHTPLTGRDRKSIEKDFCLLLISTHTPLTGRDIDVMVELSQQRISTHTPLTGRDEQKMQLLLNEIISTHTPLTGRDIPL